MDVILNYLDNMFLNLPKTAEVNRAKSELAVMMEDKYNELLAEGRKENEAIGIVISEFGNLEELADELGLEQVLSKGKIDKVVSGKHVSKEEAEEYIRLSAISAKRMAIGVFLCIISPMLLLLAGGLQSYGNLSDRGVICLGIVPLFVFIAVAVAIFIYDGMTMEKFEYLKKEVFYIDNSLKKWLHQFKEENKPATAMMTIIGVVLCILSVVPLLIVAGFIEDGIQVVYALMMLFIMVGVGVGFIIYGNYKVSCVNVLCQEGEYTKAHKEGSKIIDKIASVYWVLVTAIYLAWSFITMKWGWTWIIWPVAGVIFGVIAAVCNVLQKEE